jgi:hypothetical protein
VIKPGGSACCCDFHNILTGVDRGAAAKEGIVPWLGVCRALGVDNLAGIAENVVESVLPVLDIMVVDWASLGWVSSILINWSGHFV